MRPRRSSSTPIRSRRYPPPLLGSRTYLVLQLLALPRAGSPSSRRPAVGEDFASRARARASKIHRSQPSSSIPAEGVVETSQVLLNPDPQPEIPATAAGESHLLQLLALPRAGSPSSRRPAVGEDFASRVRARRTSKIHRSQPSSSIPAEGVVETSQVLLNPDSHTQRPISRLPNLEETERIGSPPRSQTRTRSEATSRRQKAKMSQDFV